MPRDSAWSVEQDNFQSYIKIFITQKYNSMAMATAGKQDKLNIQIKSIKTAISTIFT